MVTYVFILGMDHSGSTLLSFLLNAHPEIVTVGETCRVGLIIPDRWARKAGKCSCGTSYFLCDFWNRVLAGIAARGFGINKPDYFRFEIFTNRKLNHAYYKVLKHPLGRAIFRLCQSVWCRNKNLADKKLWAFVESVLEVSGKNIFLDASKSPSWVYPLSQNPFFDLRILNLYRDGRGVVNSWRRHFLSVPFQTLLERWRKMERERDLALLAIEPTNVFSLKYEELCAAPQDTCQRIFRFLNVEAQIDVCLGYKSQVDHHIIGNQMRLSVEETIVLDERWRGEMTQDDLLLFDALGGTIVNQRNGYGGD